MMEAASHRTAGPSLRARAYEGFRQQILTANIRPGQFISQRESPKNPCVPPNLQLTC